ncbi:MAG: hypothetical protein OXU26_16505 [Acidobacteriota bacterium]|nr:hypothetical protein [Acidobacteriota bacterium]MDE2965512.1 hypothetical protein [Acidobacteriota bacterium]
MVETQLDDLAVGSWEQIDHFPEQDKEFSFLGKSLTVPGRGSLALVWILAAAQTLRQGAGPLVFTHGHGRPLHDSQMRRLLREQRVTASLHGFRSSFRDWAAEQTDHPREVIEVILAHVIRNPVEAA